MPQASQRPADKPKQSARAKAQAFRITNTGDIIPSSIDVLSRITAEPSMKAAMTSASIKLVVEIDAAGTRVFLADQRTSQIVGGSEDLQRIGGIRAFVNRERKESTALESSDTINRVAYLANVYWQAKEQGYTQMPLEASFNAAVKPILVTLDKLKVNESKLDENKNLTNRTLIEGYLRSQFRRIKKSYFEHIAALAKGEAQKGHLAKVLFDNGVPDYVHTKLINNNLVLDKTQEITRVLFPADPSKGLTLTFAEWRDDTFLAKQGTIVSTSLNVKALVDDDKVIKALCRFDDSVDLDDETNASVMLARKGKLYVVLPHEDRRYITSAGAKVKSNGWKFPAVNMENPRGAVSALGLAMLRVTAANLQTVDLVKDFYAFICPGAIKPAEISPTNNLYAQWEKSLSGEGKCERHWLLTTGLDTTVGSRRKFCDWISTELRLTAGGSTRKRVFAALEIDKDLSTAQSDAGVDPPTDIKVDVITVPDIPENLNFARDLQPAEVPLAKQFRDNVFGAPKTKRQGRLPNAALTPLTRHSIALLERVGRLSPYLKTSLTAWLRGFSDARVQTAAARLAIASFDELFLSEGLYSDDAESLPGLDFDQSNWADVMEEEDE